MIQFDKGHEGEEHYNERKVLADLPGMSLVATGLERMRAGEEFRFGATPEDKAEAKRALQLARKALFDGDADLLILDEIVSAAGCGLLKEEDVVSLAKDFRESRPRELVMTGRGAPPRLIELADLATEMTCLKHYFNEGIPARPGIDY